MKHEVGVPVAGGSHDTSTRERASATPAPAPTGSEHKSRTATGPQNVPARPITVPLSALQVWFAAAVMHPVSVEASVRERGAVGDETVGIDDAEKVVAPSSQLSGLERVSIYHDAYRARLVECLADDYPALKYTLGDSSFEALCHAYIAKHPSRSPNLNAFGRFMSDFCRAEGAPVSDFGADLAALEWAMVEVVHAAPAKSLSEEALSAIPLREWTGARFVPSDILRVLAFDYPANAYFQSYNTDGNPNVPERGRSATAIFRDGATIWRMDLSPAMHTLLDALLGGATLGDAVEALASSGHLGEEEVPLVMQWFRDWVRYGFFSEIVVDSRAR